MVAMDAFQYLNQRRDIKLRILRRYTEDTGMGLVPHINSESSKIN
jgi:hypothetical protein